MTVRITGMRGALAAIGRIPAAMNEARAETLRDWADDVEGSAKNRAPIRSGNLDRAIESRVSEGQGIARVGVYNQNELEYAEYVEKGTSSMREQPYLVPAFEEHRAEVARKYREKFGHHVRGA